MHNYEVLSFAGLTLLGLAIGVAFDHFLALLTSLLLISLGISFAAFHHHLYIHVSTPHYRIKKSTRDKQKTEDFFSDNLGNV